MATIKENENIKVVKYNDIQYFNISIVDKSDDNEIMIHEEDVRFMLKSIIDLLLGV